MPRKGLKTGADAAYTFGLLVAMGVLAIGFVPIAVNMLGRAFGKSVYVSPISIAWLVSIAVLIPLAAGMAVPRLLPEPEGVPVRHRGLSAGELVGSTPSP